MLLLEMHKTVTVYIFSSDFTYKKILPELGYHDSDNFLYIAHGMTDTSESAVGYTMRMLRKPEFFYSASLIGKLDELNSARLFNHVGKIENLVTYGEVGIIVEPGSDSDIHIAWNCDLGTPCDEGELEKFVEVHEGKKRAPLELLIRTTGATSLKISHLVIEGSAGTRLTGVFYRKDALEGLASHIADAWAEFGHDVPLVRFPESYVSKFEHLGLWEKMRIMSNEVDNSSSDLEEFYGRPVL